MVAVDPLASLAPRWITVSIAGGIYNIKPKPAIDWLEILIPGWLYEIIPGFLNEENAYADVMDAIDEGRISEDELDKITKEVIEAASGRPWWWGTRLISMAAYNSTNWAQLNGRLVLGGVDSRKVSLAAWIDALYVACIDTFHDPEQKRKFDNTIDTPPAGEPLDEEEESRAFMALMAGG